MEINRSSLFAGLLIGLGACGFLALGGLPGAIIFAFGLIGVVLSGTHLYTGRAGIMPLKETPVLVRIWLFNVLGCILLGLLMWSLGGESAERAHWGANPQSVRKRLSPGALPRVPGAVFFAPWAAGSSSTSPSGCTGPSRISCRSFLACRCSLCAASTTLLQTWCTLWPPGTGRGTSCGTTRSSSWATTPDAIFAA